MAKKDYKSPKMIEVKVNVEQDLLSASTCVGVYSEGGSGCGVDE